LLFFFKLWQRFFLFFKQSCPERLDDAWKALSEKAFGLLSGRVRGVSVRVANFCGVRFFLSYFGVLGAVLYDCFFLAFRMVD
jgi:hypothetical protein